MADTSISNQIYLSRDQIRSQITNYLQSYLELENVDLTKGSFLSFIVNILSTLTSNLLFYEISTYREFFLTTAQLDESILNLSAFLGYNAKNANYSIANILITIPMTFSSFPTVINIPNGSEPNVSFSFKAGDTKFLTYYTTNITVNGINSANITVTENNKTFTIPFSITGGNLVFVLPVNQYEISHQEFQVDSDLKIYQFYNLDVPLTGKVSSISVTITEPNSSTVNTYVQYPSLYLMASDTKGFVLRRTARGVRLYFGNGLIGLQPTPSSKVNVIVYQTLGADGNVIAGSINQGDRLYGLLGGYSKLLNYTVTNTDPAFNGEDEESSQDIKGNAIASLVSLGRLVSEQDFKNVNVVVPTSPLSKNSLAILKRSDIIRNEIELFVNLMFASNLVPTRNVQYKTPIYTNYVPRGTTITVDGVDYLTLFNLVLDKINNSAEYHYILNTSETTPTLETSYSNVYNVSATKLTVTDSTNVTVFVLDYSYQNLNPAILSCDMNILRSGQTFNMINDSTSSHFIYTYSPTTSFPEGTVTLEFNLKANSSLIYSYISNVTIRKSLKDFMMSNLITDSTSAIIYDIPTVQKAYYNSVNKPSFELEALQNLISSLSLEEYRMITDFINIKFTNTTGKMTGMKHNLVTKSSVKCFGIPTIPVQNERYIVTGYEGPFWVKYKDKIAIYSSLIPNWTYIDSVMDDIVFVSDENKRYIYTGSSWFYPEYDIPLKIEVEVFRSPTYYGSDDQLIKDVKTSIINAFSGIFGTNISLYRSQIINVVQIVDGVRNCNLIKPESNIFFDFTLETFSQSDLLSYGPEYVYITSDSISVRIL